MEKMEEPGRKRMKLEQKKKGIKKKEIVSRTKSLIVCCLFVGAFVFFLSSQILKVFFPAVVPEFV